MSKPSPSSSLSYDSKGGYETQDNKSSSNSVASPIPGDDGYLSLSFNFTPAEVKNVGTSASSTLVKKKPSYAAVAASPPRKQGTVSSYKSQPSINSRASLFPPLSLSLKSLMGTKKRKTKTSSLITKKPYSILTNKKFKSPVIVAASNVTPAPTSLALNLVTPKPKSIANVTPAVAPTYVTAKPSATVAKSRPKPKSVASVTPTVGTTTWSSAKATKSKPKPKSIANDSPTVAPNAVILSKSKSLVTPVSKSASKCNTHTKPKSTHVTSTSDSILDIWTKDPNEDPTAMLNLARLPFAISKNHLDTSSDTSMIDSELAWPSSTPSSTNKNSVEVKQEKIQNAIGKQRNSYHTAKKRLQLGDIVKSSVGPTVNALTASGRRSNAKEKLLGQILESVENNRYRVTFTDGVTRDVSSKALKKASTSEASTFHAGINNLVNTSTDDHNVHYHDLSTFDVSPIDSSFQVNNDDDMIDHQGFEANDNQYIASIPTINNHNVNINKPKASKRKHLHSSITNKATTLDDVYKQNFKEHEARIDRLAANKETYTVKNVKTSVNWEVIYESVDLQTIKPRRREFLGIRDLELRAQISNNALPLAELILRLMYTDGQWRLFLGTMNQQVQIHNESLSRYSSKSGSSPDKRKIPHFTEKEFLIGHAIVFGAADCSERGENLWDSGRKNKWEKQWISISQPTNFGKYMRYYRFKQFKRFLPKIWQDNDQCFDTNPWSQFSPAIQNFNDIRKDLLLCSEIIPIDESMSAFRPQTTKRGGLPNISYIMRKPENLGTEFKTVGTCIQYIFVLSLTCYLPGILFIIVL